jgi:type II secretory pathway component GspD/PulD (secretin)
MGLSIVLLVTFVLRVSAADLFEKEPAAGSQRSATGSSKPAAASKAALAVAPAIRSMAAAKAAPTEQPTRLVVICLSHVPVADVARAVKQLLDSEQTGQPASDHLPSPHRATFVSEPVTNSLLVSATPQIVEAVAKLISKLDIPPSAVVVKLCIAELLPRSRESKTDGKMNDASTADKAPSMEKDGAAWLAWAKKQGRLHVLSQPQIMTLNNQRAFLKIGGLTVGLTPRISPEGLVVMQLDVDRSSALNRDGAAGPTIGKIMLQATISAKDSQTIIVGGLTECSQNGDQKTTIVAVTPCVMPSRVK